MTVKTMLLKYQRYLTYLSKLDTLSEPSGSLRVSPSLLFTLTTMMKIQLTMFFILILL